MNISFSIMGKHSNICGYIKRRNVLGIGAKQVSSGLCDMYGP